MPRKIQLETTSRYTKTDLLEEAADVREPSLGRIAFFNTWTPLDPPESDTDTFITLTSKNAARLDLISNTYYGTPALWWVLAHVNDIVDPLVDAPPGTVIRIPDFSSILSALTPT